MDSFWFYFKEGLFHVLDLSAYDHILFLIVLTITHLFSQWKKLLILVSIFTLGHTVALALSAYDIVRVNTSLVELLIVLTIITTGLYNIITASRKNRDRKQNLYLLPTLVFGVVHGFGFSTYFKMMTAGIDNKMLPLLEYTLGIEAAQGIVVIMVLIVSFMFQALFRFSQRDWVMVISAVVIGVVLPILKEVLSDINV